MAKKLKTYLVTYHMNAIARGKMNRKMKTMNSDDAAKEMEAWGVWAKSCGKGLLDMGAPLAGGTKQALDSPLPRAGEGPGVRAKC